MTTPYYCLRQILLLPSFFFPERCLINILWISGEDKDALFQQLFFRGISRWAITSSLRFCSWALTLGKSCLPSLWLADDSNCPDDLNQKAINQKVERGAGRLLLSRWDGGADTAPMLSVTSVAMKKSAPQTGSVCVRWWVWGDADDSTNEGGAMMSSGTRANLHTRGRNRRASWGANRLIEESRNKDTFT